MTRPLRIEYPGAVYHVTSRGNQKNAIFLDDSDRESFLDILETAIKRFHLILHAYCLMDNHYHLVLETPEGNLSSFMRQLNGVYTQDFNRVHKRVGHIFQGRYKAVLIQKVCYLLEVTRYVVLNPVRARLVERPEKWRYSSFCATAGYKKPLPLLATDWVLAQFGQEKHLAQKRYRKFVREGLGQESILKKTKGQILLGQEDFVSYCMTYLKEEQNLKEIPKSQRYLNRPSLASLFDEDTQRDRTRRNHSIYQAAEDYGYTQKEIADYLGLHYSTISRLVKNSQNKFTVGMPVTPAPPVQIPASTANAPGSCFKC